MSSPRTPLRRGRRAGVLGPLHQFLNERHGRPVPIAVVHVVPQVVHGAVGGHAAAAFASTVVQARGQVDDLANLVPIAEDVLRIASAFDDSERFPRASDA